MHNVAIMARLALPAIVALVAVAATVTAAGQERFSFFVASTPDSVERMLTLADLRDDDVVVDLGSGDGLIPITAATMNPRLRGWGVEINPDLVERSNRRAAEAGVADRVRFFHQNAYDADLREATVVTMWLFPEMMRLLRPIILERARPGTRVLTSTWHLGSWEPDAVDDRGYPKIFLYIVPARVAGGWRWELELDGRRHQYDVLLEQQFQKVEGVARVGWRREVLEAVQLRGAELAFELRITVKGSGLTHHAFRGRVDGDAIVGTVDVAPATGEPRTLTWRAVRTGRSTYFDPTGTHMFDPSTSRLGPTDIP